jgi:hypothetical protein
MNVYDSYTLLLWVNPQEDLNCLLLCLFLRRQKKYSFYAGEYLKSEGPGKYGKRGDGYDPAEKSDDITKRYVICFNLLELTEFDNQDCPQGGDANDNNGPTHDQPFEKIRHELSPGLPTSSIPYPSKMHGHEDFFLMIPAGYSSLARRLYFLMRA